MSSPQPQQQLQGVTEPSFARYREIIPVLSDNTHKGQGGRVCVLGGSSEYTGAPYFSGMSALRLGADLSHVICAEDAATAIKSYSPDLIVHPLIRTRTIEQLELTATDDKSRAAVKDVVDKIHAKVKDEITGILERVHVLVIGPGLSRDETMQQTAKQAIQKARSLDMPVVIDADGLFLIQNEPELIQGYSRAILTPNLVEFARLCKVKSINAEEQSGEQPAAQRLAHAFGGVVVVQKGKHDTISNGTAVHAVTNTGGLKRSGGQGDLLTGMIATSLAWIVAAQRSNSKDGKGKSVDNHTNFLVACYGACTFTRRCSQLAFEKHGRAVQSSDILDEIGPMFANYVERARPIAHWSEAIYG
ncbi:hypothetical protein CPB97_007082 [Podila verticillata]|nr:hypothetical protein CPB97_007082 [Podila verticillata]